MLLSVIYSLGIIQAWILAYFLIKSRHILWRGNRHLALILICIGMILGIFLLRLHYGNNIPAIIFWTVVSLPALFGPFIYWYISSFTRKCTLANKEILLHLIPFSALLVLFAPQIVTPLSEGIYHLDDSIVITKIIIASYVKSLSIISYLILSIRLVNQANIREALNEQALKILRLMLWLFLAVAITGSILSTLLWTEVYVSLWADFLELGFLTVLSYILSIYVLVSHVSPTHPKKRYANTNLSENARNELAEQLTELMQNDKPYTEDYYSAKYLSKQLGINEQNLSELLALSFDSNFYDFSNKYRLNQFKELVVQKPNQSLLDTAMEAGFSSKASFNRIVKSLTGLTPGQIKSQLLA